MRRFLYIFIVLSSVAASCSTGVFDFSGAGFALAIQYNLNPGDLQMNDNIRSSMLHHARMLACGAAACRVNAAGVYGTLGVSSADNVPASRAGASAWRDGFGNG